MSVVVTILPSVQGFASGDLERDAQAIRLFADAGMELLLAQVRCVLGFRDVKVIEVLQHEMQACTASKGLMSPDDV